MHLNNGACLSCHELIKDCSTTLRVWFFGQQAQTPELHAACGYRNQEAQDLCHEHGMSNAQFGKSPHNYKPALAMDIFFLIDGKANFEEHKYKDFSKKLPLNLESGVNFPKPDSDHIQERDWKSKVKGYPNGNP